MQKQLELLQRQERSTAGKSIKSGLRRAGDNSVKHEIAWPHHHCFPSAGRQLPDYKELSTLQFMVGFQVASRKKPATQCAPHWPTSLPGCSRDEWATARHAHLILLQDIERGKCSWRDSDQIEKVRICNTAHIIQTKVTTSQQKQSKSSQKEFTCGDYTNNTCKFSADHVV